MYSCLVLLLALTFVTCSNLGNDFEWRNTTSSEAVVLRPIPDGTEWVGLQKVNIWLCRIYGDTGRWIPGKLYLYQDQSRCVVGNYGDVLWSSDFQTLVTNPGTTSWIPYNGQIPKNAIDAGRLRDNRITYACRTVYNGSLLVGGIPVGDGHCFMPYTVESGQREVYSNASWEILVGNVYGMAVTYIKNH